MTEPTLDRHRQRFCVSKGTPRRKDFAVAGVLLIAILFLADSAMALDVPRLVKDHQDAVVLVTGLDKQNKAKQTGSGFFIDSNGLLVTNYHVIDGADGLVITLANGAFFVVQDVVAADREKDLVVLRVLGQNLPVLSLADSDRVQVGEDVVALGSPQGFQNTKRYSPGSLAARGGWTTCGLPCGPRPDSRHRVALNARGTMEPVVPRSAGEHAHV